MNIANDIIDCCTRVDKIKLVELLRNPDALNINDKDFTKILISAIQSKSIYITSRVFNFRAAFKQNPISNHNELMQCAIITRSESIVDLLLTFDGFESDLRSQPGLLLLAALDGCLSIIEILKEYYSVEVIEQEIKKAFDTIVETNLQTNLSILLKLNITHDFMVSYLDGLLAAKEDKKILFLLRDPIVLSLAAKNTAYDRLIYASLKTELTSLNDMLGKCKSTADFIESISDEQAQIYLEAFKFCIRCDDDLLWKNIEIFLVFPKFTCLVRSSLKVLFDLIDEVHKDGKSIVKTRLLNFKNYHGDAKPNDLNELKKMLLSSMLNTNASDTALYAGDPLFFKLTSPPPQRPKSKPHHHRVFNGACKFRLTDENNDTIKPKKTKENKTKEKK